jgi:hypothetical protein
MPSISVDAQKAMDALEKMGSKLDRTVKVAISRVAAEAERGIKNQIQPIYNDGHKRADGRTTDAKIGGPPMTRSGDLRASIGTGVTRKGFGSYVAIVGPAVLYGRAVELGAPSWRSGTKYPFISTAMKKISQAKLREIYASTIRTAL